MDVDGSAENIHLTFEVETPGKTRKKTLLGGGRGGGMGVFGVWFFVLFLQMGLETEVEQ